MEFAKKVIKSMRKNLSITLVLLLIMLMVAGCSSTASSSTTKQTEVTTTAGTTTIQTTSAETPAKNLADIVIGYIQAGPAPYYQASADGAVAAIKLVGARSVVLNSEGKPEKEMSNVEDLVSKKVDAIVLFTTNADTAQRAAEICNNADIPLILIGSAASAGPGKVTCTVKADFLLFGQTVGKYIAENIKDAKVAIIEGALGANIAEPISKGFIDESSKGQGVEIVAQQATDWARATAMATMQNLITAHPEINVVFVHNEDMAAGAVQALKDAKILDKVKVVSTNGSPEGVAMIEAGELLATANESPYQEGGLAVKAALDKLFGKEVPENISTPTILITKANLIDLIPWSVEAINKIDWTDYIK